MPFRGSATSVGNSRGIRLDAALFKEHPEFAYGEFSVDVIAPGTLLLHTTDQPEAAESRRDPVFDAFLGFLARELENNPERLSPFRASDISRASALVDGIVVDEDEDFGDDFILP